MIEAQHNRGYIQYWVKTEKEIPNHSAARDLRRCHFHSERENPRSGQPLGCPFSAHWRSNGRASSIPAVLRNLPLILLLRGGIFPCLCGDSPNSVIAYALISVFDEMSHQSQPCGILFGEI
jgi:hypothetical protein